MSKEEQNFLKGADGKKIDHVASNIKKAAVFREQTYIQGQFKKSILNKCNRKNLRLIKEEISKRDDF